jgi:hypothetical protein
MATDMADLVAIIVAALRSALAVPVEQYGSGPWTTQTVSVWPESEAAEVGFEVGNVFEETYLVAVHVEAPTPMKISDCAAVVTTVEAVKHWCRENRDQTGTDYWRGEHGGVTYYTVAWPGGGLPSFGGKVLLRYRVIREE